MAPFNEDAPLLDAKASGAERAFIGVPVSSGALARSNSRIASVARAVLVAAIACTCVAAGANHVLHRISFEPHANGIKSFLGWAPDGLDVPLNPPEVTLLAACHLVPERVPAFRTAINSWIKAAHDEGGLKRSFDKVILVDWSSEADLWGETAKAWGGAGIPTPLSFYKVYGNNGEPLKWQLAKAETAEELSLKEGKFTFQASSAKRKESQEGGDAKTKKKKKLGGLSFDEEQE